MEKEFVPYELAVKLKELGFDEECFCTYHNTKLSRNPSHKIDSKPILGQPYVWKNSLVNKSVVTAPLWQQTFDWFREKYGFICDPKKYIDWYFDIERIVSLKAETDWIENTTTFKTYEQSRHACLEKLIELIQNKNETI